jgi:hypothetical protein
MIIPPVWRSMNQASIQANQSLAQRKPQFPKPRPAIQRYGLAVLSVSAALGVALLLERLHFREAGVRFSCSPLP